MGKRLVNTAMAKKLIQPSADITLSNLFKELKLSSGEYKVEIYSYNTNELYYLNTFVYWERENNAASFRRGLIIDANGPALTHDINVLIPSHRRVLITPVKLTVAGGNAIDDFFG